MTIILTLTAVSISLMVLGIVVSAAASRRPAPQFARIRNGRLVNDGARRHMSRD